MDFNSIQFSEVFRNYAIASAAIVGLPLAALKGWVEVKSSRLASANHLAETYIKAIDKISSEEVGVALGGLYALEKIAKNNADYHHRIMEVICAFVRTKSPGSDEHHNVIDAGGMHHISRTTELLIQAALDIVQRRNSKFEVGTPSPINLSDANLARLSLEGANLKGANLDGCILVQVTLRGADLSGASMRAVEIQNADLYDADLSSAKLYGVNFSCVDLQNVRGLQRKQLNDCWFWSSYPPKLPTGINTYDFGERDSTNYLIRDPRKTQHDADTDA